MERTIIATDEVTLTTVYYYYTRSKYDLIKGLFRNGINADGTRWWSFRLRRRNDILFKIWGI